MSSPLPAYQFYPAARFCPSCRGRLATTVPVRRLFLKGPLQRMGLTCYCVSCNSRYRATSSLPFVWIAWLGPLGRWIWWQTTTLEVTLLPEKDDPGEKGGCRLT